MSATKAKATARGGQKQNAGINGVSAVILGWIAGVGSALLVTAGLIVLEVLLLKWSDMADSWLIAGNYLIRLVALWIGAGIFSARAPQIKGWLRGIMLGAGYWLFMYLMHTFTMGTWAAPGIVITDLLLCLAIGVLASAWSGRGKRVGKGRRR